MAEDEGCLRFRVVTDDHDVLFDELVHLYHHGEADAAAARWADVTSQATERSVHTTLVITFPTTDLSPAELTEAIDTARELQTSSIWPDYPGS